jgi:hypothetical protein
MNSKTYSQLLVQSAFTAAAEIAESTTPGECPRMGAAISASDLSRFGLHGVEIDP